MWYQFRVFTSQVLVIEDFAFTAGDETRVTFHAGDQVVAVTGHRETGVRPEFG